MYELTSILPPNSTPLERALEAAMAGARPDLSVISDMLDPMECPVALLPWLAWIWSVDYWDDTWGEDIKRQTVVESIEVHRHKGTVDSVKRALKLAGFGDARLVEGREAAKRDGSLRRTRSETREPSDHWAEYRLYIERPITIDQAAFIKSILAHVVPAHCRLKGLFFTQAAHRRNRVIRRGGQHTRGVVV